MLARRVWAIGPSRWSLLVFFVVAGCSSESQKAQESYDMAKRNGASASELCERGQAVAEAYLREGNEQAYQLADLYADGECNDAVLEQLQRRRYGGSL